MQNTGSQFIRLIEIIRRLRAPDGCPWDMRQTPESFKTYIIEEAYELLEAIDHNNADEIREELGDLLFQVIFLNNLYAENHLFTMDEVIETISAKMIRRHPHVFGDEEIADEQELRRKWQRIKEQEKKGGPEPGGLLASIPKALPALRRAQRISERAARTGFTWPGSEDALTKLDEEIAELREAMATGDRDRIREELGDALFALVTVGRMGQVNSEDALSAAIEKFISRFTRLEHLLHQQGKSMSDCDREELAVLWNKAKTI